MTAFAESEFGNPVCSALKKADRRPPVHSPDLFLVDEEVNHPGKKRERWVDADFNLPLLSA
jgi:hypothetical protein